MSKNLKTLICCLLALLFVSGTVVAVFADSNDLFAKEAESITGEEASEEVPEEESSEEVTNPAPKYKLGDVNMDGRITATDARLALRYSAQLENLTAEQCIIADVIINGKVEANDARLILRCAAKLIYESDLGVKA